MYHELCKKYGWFSYLMNQLANLYYRMVEVDDGELLDFMNRPLRYTWAGDLLSLFRKDVGV